MNYATKIKQPSHNSACDFFWFLFKTFFPKFDLRCGSSLSVGYMPVVTEKKKKGKKSFNLTHCIPFSRLAL